MEDIYQKLEDCLEKIVSFLKEFEDKKDDFIKPNIRAFQVELIHLSKIISKKIFQHANKLSNDIDVYLSNPKKGIFLSLINDAINLQNDLWEL
ncbi:MAG: hypothetical protein JXA94_07675 [Parachlamydiales bacterium]|nr:hypothetical protein [Parachlamydiales bacterium]